MSALVKQAPLGVMPAMAHLPDLPGGVDVARATDPRQLGCRCDECPLGEYHRKHESWRPVLPEVHANDGGSIIAEFPGGDEIIHGRPLVGRSGEELELGLRAVGMRRSDYTIDNALLCGVPLNDPKMFMGRVRKENQQRIAQGLKPHPSPYECCRPHVIRQVARSPITITLGAAPTAMVIGRATSIRKVRGAFIEGWYTGAVQRPGVLRHAEGMLQVPEGAFGHFAVTPTLNPAFILREPAWRPFFQRDLQRAQRWQQGTLDRVPNTYVHNPTAAELERFLFDDAQPFHSVDIETSMGAGIIYCIGFGAASGDTAYVVRFRSVNPGEGHVHILNPYAPVYNSVREGWAVLCVIWRWLISNRRKVGHNFRYFDTECLLRCPELRAVARILMNQSNPHWEIAEVFDTIPGFRAWHSEVTRDLYTLGTYVTDVSAWKAAADDRRIAQAPRSNEELAEYNAMDCKVNARCVLPMWRAIVARQQVAVVQLDQQIQSIAREMHTLGIRVDQPKRKQMEEEYREKVQKEAAVIRRLTWQTFNPRSNADWSKLLYTQWRLPYINMTPTGDPACDDVTFKTLLVTPGLLKAEQVACIKAARAFRTADKVLGTYLLRWRPWNDYRLTSDGKMVGGICGPDGRLHPHYNTHSPKTGRISSSGPNAQNVQKFLRTLWIPEDGHIFIGADYDQIELRLFAAVAGIKSYMRVFEGGGDPHSTTALLLYGAVFETEMQASMTPAQWARYKATGIAEKAKGKNTDRYVDLRTFAKTFVYAVLYGGSARTVFDNVSRAENEETGELLFPDMTIDMVTAAYNTFMRNAPEIQAFWEQQLNLAAANQYVLEPILGRRRDFPGFERNEILNFPIQGGAAIIMSQGLVRVRQRVIPNFAQRTGTVLQCHDAAYLEVPKAQANDIIELVSESMTARYPHLPGVVFSAEAGAGQNMAKAA